jgi:structural maintenance of chromosome 3 (chondroitin sulfate proteoglycan 6)
MPFPFISPLLLLNNPFSSDVNSLFHVVVENDDISTKIIQVLTREKGGRVTFIPLNRVHAPNVNVPQSSDFVPLLKKLKFRPDHRRAF